jgi:UDPglucose--hexose-1-phosphate uridylyltransferase
VRQYEKRGKFGWIGRAGELYSRPKRMLNLATESHRRYNPLKREWVLVSPQRTARPWQGRVETVAASDVRPYEPECYMCPGNARANGKRNPKYSSTFVFENDFPALSAGVSQEMIEVKELLIAQGEPGICRVVCFSPRHDLRLPRMERAAVRGVVDVLAEQHAELGALPWVNYVLPFENHGAAMGASNPHPHCQIWANAHLPNEPAQELLATSEYHRTHGSCLLCDYAKLEAERRERIVCENEWFAAVVPFWAVWPFETLVMSKRHLGGFDELSSEERHALADIQIRVTTRYDNLFKAPFAYSMGFHCKPTDGIAHPGWHFHAHYYPPLLRSATVRKFQVGYEMLGTPQRDITPEEAAERLRSVPEKHYMDGVEALK